MWQFWCCKTACHPCMIIYCSRCCSEVFFVGDSNGRTVSIFVMCCGAASLLDHQNCCCGDFWDEVWFPFDVLQSWLSVQGFRCIDVYVNLKFWCAECLYYLIYVFISFFLLLTEKKEIALTWTDFSAFQDLADKFLQKNINLSNWSSCLFFPRIKI